MHVEAAAIIFVAHVAFESVDNECIVSMGEPTQASFVLAYMLVLNIQS